MNELDIVILAESVRVWVCRTSGFLIKLFSFLGLTDTGILGVESGTVVVVSAC